MEIYSEQELININKWLYSKYGRVFIANQKDFMSKKVLIGNYVSRQFQERAATIDAEFKKKIKALSELP